jgi:transposase
VSADPKSAARAPTPSPIVADAPGRTVSGATASPATFARIVVARFVEQVPFERQEQSVARDGFPVARGTFAAWAGECHEASRAVVDAMLKDATDSARVIVADPGGALVLNAGAAKRGHFWVCVADHDHVFFRFTPRPSKADPEELFAGFEGALQSDAAAAYELLARDEKPTEVTWSQVRRRFLEAARDQREAAFVAVGLIEKLFAIERELKELAPARRIEARKARCLPLLDQLTQWKEKRFASPTFDACSPLARALVELDRHWMPLTRFLGDGRMRFDDNPSELEVRRAVTGRKSWLFVAGDDDAPIASTFVSLVASARLHALDPEAYLRDLFRALPSWPRERVIELAPNRWARTRARV